MVTSGDIQTLSKAARALARQHGMPGLRYPAEDDVYEKPILDRLGL